VVLLTGIATVNKEMHIDILHRLRDDVRRKRHEKWRTVVGFSFGTML
jgi:hypothetical protein